ncbi:hypothetical protein [Streptomyces deserti]
MAVTTEPLLFAPGLAALTGMLFLAGMSIAPTLIITMELVSHLAPPAQLTGSITWIVSGLSDGVALACARSGWVVDAAGASAGHGVPCEAALLAASTVSLPPGLDPHRRGVTRRS